MNPRPRELALSDDVIDDAALVARLPLGDGRALDILVSRHSGRIANFLSHVLEDPSWVDDLTQEVFVRLCTHASRYDPRFPLVTWLLRIARNLAVDLSRRERARRNAHAGLREWRLRELQAPAADHRAEMEELRDAFLLAVKAVPEPFRTVFVLKEIELLSYEEIARVVGVNTKTVSTRLTRARDRMRALLKGWDST